MIFTEQPRGKGAAMAYKDMFTILVVDSRIEHSQSPRDAFDCIVGHLRDDHHLRTDVLGTTRVAVMRLRSDASVACLLLEWGGKGGGIDATRVLDTVADVGREIPVFPGGVQRRPGARAGRAAGRRRARPGLPGGGCAGLRSQIRQPAFRGLDRTAQDAVLRARHRVQRFAQRDVDVPGPQRRHVLPPQPRRARAL